MLKEIQANKRLKKVYCMDEQYNIMATFPMSTDFYEGTNEAGQRRSNADNGTYEVGTNGDCYNDKDNNSMEAAYGWAYIGIDDRGRALHGGGSNLADPYAPYQTEFLPTYGCFRMYNADVYWLLLQKQRAEQAGIDVVITVVD